MQFTAMNTVTLKDLDPIVSGSGSTMFSMVQMVAMSFGVAIAGVVLKLFQSSFGTGSAFTATFVTLGLTTCLSSTIFAKIPAHAPASAKARTPKPMRRLVVGRRAHRIASIARREAQPSESSSA
jgi:hypothetical protein